MVQGALREVRVITQKVAHGRTIQDRISLDPRLREAALLQEPALVDHDRVPVLPHPLVLLPSGRFLAFDHGTDNRRLSFGHTTMGRARTSN